MLADGLLFKRGKRNPVWIGRYREDFISEDGLRLRRRRSVVLGPVRKIGAREAERLLSDRLAETNQGRHKPEMIVGFEKFVLERWEPNIFPTLQFSTARKNRHVVRAYLLQPLGKLALAEIGSAEVQSVIAHYARRLAPYTVTTIRNVLSKIFATAVRWGYLQVNPVAGVQVPALVNRRDRRTLAPEEVRRLLVALEKPYRTMILLAILSGLRRGELFGLRWKCVNFEEGSILVAESVFEGRSSAPKTRASRRKVFVDELVLEALRALRPVHHQPDDFVFPNEKGGAMHPGNVQRRVLNPACERARIPRVSWHNFRYTYATWASPTGESIKALQAQLGHTDSKLTLSVYTQPMPEAQRGIGRKVAGVLALVGPKFWVDSDSPSGLVQ